MKEGLVGEFCSSRRIMLFWFCAAVGRETAEKEAYESGTRLSLRLNLLVSLPREHQVLCIFWPNLTKISAFWQTLPKEWPLCISSVINTRMTWGSLPWWYSLSSSRRSPFYAWVECIEDCQCLHSKAMKWCLVYGSQCSLNELNIVRQIVFCDSTTQ